MKYAASFNEISFNYIVTLTPDWPAGFVNGSNLTIALFSVITSGSMLGVGSKAVP